MSKRIDTQGPGAAPLVLTAKEQQIVSNLRAMDDETCGEVVQMILGMTAGMSKRYPRHKRPALRLVAGGVK